MRIIVTGGGTGGHIYPALAFVKYLRRVIPNVEVLYIGTKKGLESKIVPAANVDFETIEIQSIRRNFSLSNFRTMYLLATSIGKAKRILRDFKPDIVLGTGGYVSAPVLLAALRLKIPTIIHEQNSYPGMTNRYLGKRVNRVAVAMQAAKGYFPMDKVVFTGNPRAQEVADLQRTSSTLVEFNLSVDKRTVVIFGGSRGALTINKAVVEAFSEFSKKNYQVIYASGERYYEEYKVDFIQADNQPNIAVRPYINNMSEVLASADLFLGRSGATTIAEITALGLPAIFIPSPNVVADHQTKNAQALVDKGAALLIRDDELTGENIVQSISEILENSVKYNQMATASRKEGVSDSSERVLKLINEVLDERRRV